MIETDVATFTRQLRQDGIDAARSEAERIMEEARAQAAGILQEAEATARRLEADSRAAMERDRTRFGAEIRLAARDTMLAVQQQIEQVVMRLLRAKIDDALAAEEVVRTAIIEIIKHHAPGSAWEIAVGSRIGASLVAAAVNELFKGREATFVVIEEFGRSGLEFRTAGGDEVLELSADSVAEVFQRLLSPELCKLVETLPA
jgi:V/A-type H+-transporting ATPase subunit E